MEQGYHAGADPVTCLFKNPFICFSVVVNNLPRPEEEFNLLLGVLHGIGSMHQIPSDFQSKVSANRPCISIDGVCFAHRVAHNLHGIGALKNGSNYWP